MSIFGRLGYDSANTASVVTDLSANVVLTMSQMPALLNSWQTDDVSDNIIGGYFSNPVASITQNIWYTANTILAIPNLSTAQTAINVAVTNLSESCNSFFLHTNRISGVSSNTDEPTQPHYNTAMATAKVIMFITFQSDGVQNNAPLMGNFTSLTIRDTLSTMNTTIQSYPTTIKNSIVVTSDEFGTTYTSNLTTIQVTTIINGINSIKNIMDSRRIGDVNFYNNSRSIVDDYNSVKQFANPGQSETYLINNYIGTDKLKSRINS